MSDIISVQMSIPERSLTQRSLAQSAGILPSQLAQRSNAPIGIPLTLCRTWNDLATNLPAVAANDDLGLVTGTAGTAFPKLTAGDVKTLSGSRSAGFIFHVPETFDSGETLTIRVRAAVETSSADGSCTLDLDVYSSDDDGTSSANLYAGSPQSINSQTPGNFDFNFPSAGLTAGQAIYCVLTIAYVDAATGTAVTPAIYGITLLADLR